MRGRNAGSLGAILEKGKPGASRGRKAVGFKPSYPDGFRLPGCRRDGRDHFDCLVGWPFARKAGFFCARTGPILFPAMNCTILCT
jgi:hypothetical protein